MNHPTASLGDLAEITSGFAFKSEQFNSLGNGLPLVRIRDVVDGNSDTYYSGDYKPEFVVLDGDALIGMDGQFNLSLWRGGRALLNQRVCKVSAVSKRLDQSYLLHFLPAALKEIEDRTPFVTVKHLSVKTLREIAVPLPPLLEQRRIAAILDKADALRAKRREAIVKLDQMLQAVFVDMFGDPLTNSNGWCLQEINNLCTLVRGSSPRPQGDPNFFGGPVPRLMVADLTRDGWFVTPRIDSLTLEGAKRSRPTKAGTVVMAVSGNVGLASIISIDACIHDGFVGFSGLDESKVLPIFLLMSLHFLKNSHHGITAGAIFQNLTTTDIKKLAIPVPPMNDQRSYAQRFNAIQKQKSKSGIAADKFEKFYQSIQLQAFGRAR